MTKEITTVNRRNNDAFVRVGNWSCFFKNMAHKTDDELIEIAKEKEKKWTKSNKESEERKEIIKKTRKRRRKK